MEGQTQPAKQSLLLEYGRRWGLALILVLLAISWLILVGGVWAEAN